MTLESEIQSIEKQIAELKRKRDKLISGSELERSQLQKILSVRAPQNTLCQLLRDIHKTANDEEKTKIETCLLIAKKMNKKLVEYAGNNYSKNWYDEKGEFINMNDGDIVTKSFEANFKAFCESCNKFQSFHFDEWKDNYLDIICEKCGRSITTFTLEVNEPTDK